MDQGGQITTLGEQYIGAITPNVSPDYQPGIVHGGSGNASTSSGSVYQARLSNTAECVVFFAWIAMLLAIIL